MKIKIENAKPEDVRGIAEVFYKTWLATYPNEEYGITVADVEDNYKDSFTAETLEKRRKQILEMPSNTKYVSAKDGDTVVGICRAIKHEDRNQLQAIYVLPEYQGKGIGHALWLEAEKFFDPMKETFVQVATYNKKAIAFYEKLGFKDNGKRFSDERFRFKSGNIIPEMEMSKKISK